MLKILIADDHPLIRFGLKQIINDEEDMVLFGEAENGFQALELLKTNEYDIFILDLSLPDINGLEILQRLSNIKPNLPVLILSAHPEEQYALKCIKAGAVGYLNKISANNLLIKAIRKIMSGDNFISPGLSEKLKPEPEKNLNSFGLKRDINSEKASINQNTSERKWECRNCGYIFLLEYKPHVCPKCLNVHLLSNGEFFIEIPNSHKSITEEEIN